MHCFAPIGFCCCKPAKFLVNEFPDNFEVFHQQVCKQPSKQGIREKGSFVAEKGLKNFATEGVWYDTVRWEVFVSFSILFSVDLFLSIFSGGLFF